MRPRPFHGGPAPLPSAHRGWAGPAVLAFCTLLLIPGGAVLGWSTLPSPGTGPARDHAAGEAAPWVLPGTPGTGEAALRPASTIRPASLLTVYDGANASVSGCPCSRPSLSIGVSPNATIELIDAEAAWFDPSGAPIAQTGLASLFGAGTDTVRSPHVVYDPSCRCFLAAAVDLSVDRLLLAASSGPLANATWTSWSILPASNATVLTPSIGYATGVVGIAATEADPTNGSLIGSQLWVVNEYALVTNGTLEAATTGPQGTSVGALAVPAVGPSASGLLFVGDGNRSGPLELTEAHGVPPATTTFITTTVNVTAHALPASLPQAGSNDSLEAPPANVAGAIEVNGTLAAVRTVGATSGHDAVQLVQVSLTNRSIRQDLLIDDGVGLAYPAVQADSAGNLGLVALRANATTLPTVVTVGQPWNEPGGLTPFDPVAVSVGPASGGCAPSVGCAWGPASSGATDPAGGPTIWLAAEYVGSLATNWSTVIAETRYPALSVAALQADMPSIDVEQFVNFSVLPLGGTGGELADWSSVGLDGCIPTSGTTLECQPTRPVNSTFQVAVRDRGGATAQSPPLTFRVWPTLNLTSVRPDRSDADVGQIVNWSATVVGGAPPISVRWSPPVGATCTNLTPLALSCTVDTTGTLVWAVGATDANFVARRGSGQILAWPALALTLNNLSATALFRGDLLNLSASVAGGRAPFSWNWSGLPAGCRADSSPQLTCRPDSVGSFAVTVLVRDANGAARSAGARITVAEPVQPSPPNPIPLLGVVATTVVAAALLTLWLWRRQRRRPPEVAIVPPEGAPPVVAAKLSQEEGGPLADVSAPDSGQPDPDPPH